MILSLAVFVVILVLSIPSAVIFIPLAAITGDVRPLYAVVCFIVRAGYFVAGIHFQVKGLEHVPRDRACIFMANHVSNLDPPALISRIPGQTSAFAKRSVFKLPLFGYCLKLAEYIPVDRTGNKASAQASVRRIQVPSAVDNTLPRDPARGVLREGRFGGNAARTEGAGRDHEPQQVLHRPAVVREVIGQEIQQFRMRGLLTRTAPVVRRPHQRLAEMPLPDPVDHDPRRERIVGTGDPPRRNATATSRSPYQGSATWRLVASRPGATTNPVPATRARKLCARPDT